MAKVRAEPRHSRWPAQDNASRSGDWQRVLEYRVRTNDLPNFRVLYKDIFRHRIYHFDSERSDPLILDCGSNTGMSILYFKHVHPGARIVAFEPDPAILPCLKETLAANGLTDVRIVEAALCPREGPHTLYSDGKYASSLVARALADAANPPATFTVPCVRLRDYLSEPVDFLKMNIEGAEWDVLVDSEDRLRRVGGMVIEYHHVPGLPRTLHKILELLDRQGFEYLINDFDAETNPQAQPPFRLGPNSRYYLLVYARRKDAS